MEEFDLKKRYIIFLNSLTKQLERMFNEQKEFIKCRKGCAYCCQEGEYPFSKLEADYIIDAYKQLSSDIKEKILNNLKKLKQQKSEFKGEQFMYACPFLVDNECSVYNNRGIICRTFGLLCDHDNDKFTIPFCHEYGLNYSNVYDGETGTIIGEKNGVKLCETEPKAYRVTRENVMAVSMAKDLNLQWGESKTLFDYLIEYDIENL